MTLSRSKGKLRSQSPRSDELADPVPEEAARIERRQDGRVATKEAAKALGAKGLRSRALNRERSAFWANRLGLDRFMPDIATDPHFAEVLRESDVWRAQTLEELGKNVGDGVVNTIAGTLVELASYQRAAALWAFATASKSAWVWDRDEDAKPAVKPSTKLLEVANRLVEGFRTTALAAWDVCAREAKVRPANGGAVPPWMMVVADDKEPQK